MKKTQRRSISKADHIYLVTEWWRRIREEPEKFRREFQVIQEMTAEEAAGRQPTIGEIDWNYSNRILDEREAAKAKTKKKPAVKIKVAKRQR